MATKIFDSSALVIKYDGGMVNGKTKTITKSYGSLKEGASVDDVYAVANQIQSLQEHTLSDIQIRSVHTVNA